jgi:predicted GNAT superfamily acetyltransferase
LPEESLVRVEVPYDIQEVKERDPAAARRWREATRRAFQSYFERGYLVLAFGFDASGERAFYRMGRAST